MTRFDVRPSATASVTRPLGLGAALSRSRPGTRRRAIVPLLAVALAGAACEAEEAPRADAVEGAPVEIVEPAELVIGTMEGAEEEELHEVGSPALLPDGSVAIPLRSEGEIRVFGPDGTFRERYGGAGEGPGEFQFLAALFVRGDTLEAWDAGAYRMTRFLPDGEVRTVSLVEDYEGDARLDAAVGRTSDGWLVAALPAAGGGQRDRLEVHRFTLDGGHAGVVASVEGMLRDATGNFSGPEPLSPKAQFDIRSGGEGDRLYVAETLTPRVAVHDLSGGMERTIAWEPDPTWAPDEAWGRVVRAAENRGDSEDRMASLYPLEAYLAASPPEAAPAFSDFLVDEEGFIWVRPYEPERDAVGLGGNVGVGRTGPGGEWTVLSPEGEVAGSVTVPEGFEPYQVTADAVVGVHTDELGVESVRVYALRRE